MQKKILNNKKILSFLIILIFTTIFFIYRYENEYKNNTVNNSENNESIIREKDKFVIETEEGTEITPEEVVQVKEINTEPIQNNEKFEIRSLGGNNIALFEGMHKMEQTYLYDLSNLNFEYLALSWYEGELLMGGDPADLQKVDKTHESVAETGKMLSEMIPFKPSELYLKSTEDTLVKVELILFEQDLDNQTDSITPIQPSEIVNKDSGAKYSSLEIISRDEWGAETNLWDPYEVTDIDDPSRFMWNPAYYRASRFVIHHTATSNSYPDPSDAVRSIYLYHAHSRGWGDIGYNYLIDNQGNIYEGKAGGDEVFAYHALTEANTMSIGISLIGNFEVEAPTSLQKAALERLLAEKSAFYNIDLTLSDGSLSDWLDPKVTVFGDRDVWFWCYSTHVYSYRCPTNDQWIDRATSCPGVNLHSRIGSEIVPAAKIYKQNNFAQIKSVQQQIDKELEESVNNRGEFYVVYNYPRDVSPEILQNKLPSFSGIIGSSVEGNVVTVKIGDWNDGVLVPTEGWDGNFPDTFFPPSSGKLDRMRTLMKIFALDPEVKGVGIEKIYKLSPLE